MSKWIVLAAGALMSVFGLAWLWDGLGIVQVERGWSAVIAGSVIFSAGAVLMGLSALIRQVEALTAPRGPASAKLIARESDYPDKAPSPVSPKPAAPVLQPSGRALDAQEREDLARSEARARGGSTQETLPPALRPAPSLPKASVPDFGLGAPSIFDPDHQPSENGEPETSEARAPEALRREAPKLFASRQEAGRQDSGRQNSKREETPADNASASAHWKSLFAKSKASERDSDLGGAPPVVSPVAQPARATEASSLRPEEGRIARRYESQGVRYSLYEDGSIDAETDTGMYRFGSLTELRVFLDKRES